MQITRMLVQMIRETEHGSTFLIMGARTQLRVLLRWIKTNYHHKQKTPAITGVFCYSFFTRSFWTRSRFNFLSRMVSTPFFIEA